MRRSGAELNGGGRLARAAVSKMGFVRSINSESRGSNGEKAGKTANSRDFRNDRRGAPLRNGFRSGREARVSPASSIQDRATRPGRRSGHRVPVLSQYCSRIVHLRPNMFRYRSLFLENVRETRGKRETGREDGEISCGTWFFVPKRRLGGTLDIRCDTPPLWLFIFSSFPPNRCP